MSIVDPIAPLGFYCGYLGKEAADPDAETELERQHLLFKTDQVNRILRRSRRRGLSMRQNTGRAPSEVLRGIYDDTDFRDYTGTGRTFVTGPVTTTTPTTPIEDKPWYSRWMQRLTPAELDSYTFSRDAQSWKDMEYAASQGVPYAKQYLKNNPKPKEKGKILSRDLAKRVRILSMPLPTKRYGAVALGRFIILNSAFPSAQQSIPHELAHVSQQAQVGTIPMALKYISDYVRNRRHMPTHMEAYRALPDEVDAVDRDEKWRVADWVDKRQYMQDAHQLARARQLENSGKPPETGYMTNYSMESGIPTSERIYNPRRHYPRLNEAYRELFSRPGKMSNRNEQAAALAGYKRWEDFRDSQLLGYGAHGQALYGPTTLAEIAGIADYGPYVETRRTHRRLRGRDDDRFPGPVHKELIKRDKDWSRLTPGTDYPEYNYRDTISPWGVPHGPNTTQRTFTSREDIDRQDRLVEDRDKRRIDGWWRRR